MNLLNKFECDDKTISVLADLSGEKIKYIATVHETGAENSKPSHGRTIEVSAMSIPSEFDNICQLLDSFIRRFYSNNPVQIDMSNYSNEELTSIYPSDSLMFEMFEIGGDSLNVAVIDRVFTRLDGIAILVLATRSIEPYESPQANYVRSVGAFDRRDPSLLKHISGYCEMICGKNFATKSHEHWNRIYT